MSTVLGVLLGHVWVECGFNRKCRICGLLWVWGTSVPTNPPYCPGDTKKHPYR